MESCNELGWFHIQPAFHCIGEDGHIWEVFSISGSLLPLVVVLLIAGVLWSISRFRKARK